MLTIPVLVQYTYGKYTFSLSDNAWLSAGTELITELDTSSPKFSSTFCEHMELSRHFKG